MAWTKIDQSIRDHRKILDLSDALKINIPMTIGLLVSLWLWAMDNTSNGCIDGTSARTISRAAGWEGDPEQLMHALINVRFVDIDDAGSKFIHGWTEYEGKYVAEREREKERSQNRRNSQRARDQRSTGGQPPVDRETAAGIGDKTRSNQIIADQSRADRTTTATPVPYEQIVDLYNVICVDLQKVRTITPKRKEAMGECWAVYGRLGDYEGLFRATEASTFLLGDNNRGWCATFDWLMSVENMGKVLEGQYTDHQTHRRTNNTLDVLSEIIAREADHDEI